MKRVAAFALNALVAAAAACGTASRPQAPPDLPALTRESASNFARITLACVTKVYPNSPGYVLNAEADVQPPAIVHPSGAAAVRGLVSPIPARLDREEPKTLLDIAVVTDRSDPQLGHLDGLNLSRAWCMRHIAAALPEGDGWRAVLAAAGYAHATDALQHVATGHYEGEHWLASFAVYLLTER